MYIRFSVLLPVATLAIVAAAPPGKPKPRSGSSGQCNTGTLDCCNATYQPTDSAISGLLGLLGIVIGDLTGLVGVGCSPITVIGGGTGGLCSQQPLCCNNNIFNGTVGIDCNPISITK